MREGYQTTFQLILVSLVVLIVFSPTLKNRFTNWDDPVLITKNPDIQDLSTANLAKLFSTSYGGFGGYTPFVLLSYALEVHFFGLDPQAFHLTNLLLHVLNTILVFFLIWLISQRIWMSFLVSMLFGVHPLHVEAVAWIQGRKDLLFSLFFLAGAMCYVLYLQKGRRRIHYVLTVLFFIVSLFSKITAVSFPLIMLLLEWYSRRDIDKTSLVRVVPFFALSMIFLALAVLTNSPGVTPAGGEVLSPFGNIIVFFYAFVFYVSKSVLPIVLLARYSIQTLQQTWPLIGNTCLFLFFCGLAFRAYRLKPVAVTFGTAFFIFTLAPTLPFHFVGQPYADRYMYLPIIGLLFIIALIADNILMKKEITRVALRLAVLSGISIMIILLGLQTWRLAHVWHDSFSLWTHVLGKDPINAVAYFERASAFSDIGQYDKALADYNKAANLTPNNPHIFNNRGFLYFKKEIFEKALADYSQALVLNPLYTIAYINRGILWGRLGKYEAGVQDFSTALKVDRSSYLAFFYRGMAYKEMGRAELALEDWKTALKIQPTEQLRSQIESLERATIQKK